MRHPPITLVALLGSLLFQVGDAISEDISADEALKKAEVSALRASREHANGYLESAEQFSIQSLLLLPRRSNTEEKRSAYRKQLAEILADLQGTSKAPKLERTETDWENVSDVEDKIPFFGYQAGPSAATKDIILPQVEFSAISLTEALASLEAQSKKSDTHPLEVDRGVKIYLYAPSVVANTAITLHLTNVPLSEAILRTAELGSCRVFHLSFGRSVMISCVDLLAPVIVGDKISVSPAVGRWHEAFWKLQNAESAAESSYPYKSRVYYREALNLYAILSVRYPEFHPDMVRERMKDIANKLEGGSSIKRP